MANQEPEPGWYVKTNQGIFGPYSTEQLRSYGDDGHISTEHFIRKGESGQWTMAGSVRGLKVRETSSQDGDLIPVNVPVVRNPIQRSHVTKNSPMFLLLIGGFAVILLLGIGTVIGYLNSTGLKPFTNASGEILMTFGDERSVPLSAKEIVKSNERSVFLLQGVASGSGFLINDQMIVTNQHVIEIEPVNLDTGQFTNLQAFSPAAEYPKRGPYKVTLLFEDKEHDIAVLQLDRKVSFPPTVLAWDYQFQRGEQITIIGHPGHANGVLQSAVTTGILSTIHTINGIEHYQLSAAINPGNSGGPVFDSSGRVIGVIRSKAIQEEGVSFCLPADVAITAISVSDLGSQIGLNSKELWRSHNLRIPTALAQQMAKVGDIAVVTHPTLPIFPVGNTAEDLGAVGEALATSNWQAYQQLVASGRCIEVQVGTKVQILESDVFCRIRILDGLYAGRTGVISIDGLRQSNQINTNPSTVQTDSRVFKLRSKVIVPWLKRDQIEQ